MFGIIEASSFIGYGSELDREQIKALLLGNAEDKAAAQESLTNAFWACSNEVERQAKQAEPAARS